MSLQDQATEMWIIDFTFTMGTNDTVRPQLPHSLITHLTHDESK